MRHNLNWFVFTAALAATAVLGSIGNLSAVTAPYTAIDLNPVGFNTSIAYDICGGQQVGSGTGNFSIGYSHALLWSGSAESKVDMQPNTSPPPTTIYATNGAQQVGISNDRATLWQGTPYNVVDLHPDGFISTEAFGVCGAQQVGNGYGTATGNSPHAMLWNGTAGSYIDLNPSGFTLTYAKDTNGTQQVGYGKGTATGGNYHALLWNGSATNKVDLNPSGFSTSYGEAMSGMQQVGSGKGSATGGNFHALLWNGTPGSKIDLNPSGFEYSEGHGTNGTQQVGLGYSPAMNGNFHAMLWSGSSSSAIDLHQYLPPDQFVKSRAYAIDSQGNIVGCAFDGAGNSHAILWKPVPEPSTFVLLGFGVAGLFAWSWRRIRKAA